MDEAGAEHWMCEVAASLVEIGDGEEAGPVAVAEPGELREDEPHPMGPFAASAELGQHLVQHRFLRIEKALQVAHRRSRLSERPARRSF